MQNCRRSVRREAREAPPLWRMCAAGRPGTATVLAVNRREHGRLAPLRRWRSWRILSVGVVAVVVVARQPRLC
ncbi:MAG: hypothetical protein ABI690_20710 [Chloroflexota bacterium]